MEIRIERYEMNKMLKKLIPINSFEGYEIYNIESNFDGTIIINLRKVEEGEEDAD